MIMCVAALASVVVWVGCTEKSESEPTEGEGVAERAGAAVDRAVDKTKDVATTAAEATKDTTGKAVEKTGEVLGNAGDAVGNAGAGMQNSTTDK